MEGKVLVWAATLLSWAVIAVVGALVALGATTTIAVLSSWLEVSNLEWVFYGVIAGLGAITACAIVNKLFTRW